MARSMIKRKKHEAVLKVERVAIGDLHPHPKNPREHPKPGSEEWTVLKRSIEHDYFDPIVWNKRNGMLVSGHLRTKVLTEMGVTSVDVVVVDYDEPTHEARLIAANEQAGEWNRGIMRDILKELDAQFRELTGMMGDEIDKLTIPSDGSSKEAGELKAKELGALAERWGTKRGQLWILGDHRLVCGDCTVKSDVTLALGGFHPNLMVTDPHYGVNYDPSWRAEVNNDGLRSKRAIGKVANDDRSDWMETWSLFPGNVAYVWHSYCHSFSVEGSLIECGFITRAQIIWAKQAMVFGRGDYHSQHEACWYSVRKGKSGGFVGDRKQTTLWEISNNNSANPESEETFGHGTQKPIECMRRPILNNSKRGDSVYDPFLGSGTTLMAAEQSGRKCIGIEIDPIYVALVLERFHKTTGKIPTLNQ